MGRKIFFWGILYGCGRNGAPMITDYYYYYYYYFERKRIKDYVEGV